MLTGQYPGIYICGREGKEIALDRRKGGAAVSLSVTPVNLIGNSEAEMTYRIVPN